jgi:hypothetical protein
MHWCKRCPKLSTAVSSNARYHLEKVHRLVVTEAPTKHEAQVQQDIGLSFRHAKEQASEKMQEKETSILRNAIKHEAFLEALTLLITRGRLPHNCVNWPELHALLYTVNLSHLRLQLALIVPSHYISRSRIFAIDLPLNPSSTKRAVKYTSHLISGKRHRQCWKR